MTVQCQGTTKAGHRCGNHLKAGILCHLHKSQVPVNNDKSVISITTQPETSNVEIQQVEDSGNGAKGVHDDESGSPRLKETKKEEAKKHQRNTKESHAGSDVESASTRSEKPNKSHGKSSQRSSATIATTTNNHHDRPNSFFSSANQKRQYVPTVYEVLDDMSRLTKCLNAMRKKRVPTDNTPLQSLFISTCGSLEMLRHVMIDVFGENDEEE
ncbi:hypothetical protein IWX49DRAFT_595461 [Phyllosticta citricarpa]